MINVEYILFGPDGKIKQKVKSKNLLVNTGLQACVKRFVQTSDNYRLLKIKIGTSDTAVANGQVDLQGAVATEDMVDGYPDEELGAYQVVYRSLFAAGTGTGTIKEAGLFTSDLSMMFARNLLDTPIEKQAADSLQVTWTVTFNRS